MSKKVKVAIIGYGHLGKWHAEKAFNHPNAELVAIVEPSETAQMQIKDKYPTLTIAQKTEDILDIIDAAFVVTPTSFHYQITKKLIENNIHIFCEKPLTSKLDEALDIKRLVKERSNLLQVGHSERFHQVWEQRKEFVDFLKAPATIKINRFAPFKGRATDVDVVQDLMIHDLDILNWLLNETPTSVRSTGYKIRTDKWDYVCSHLEYKSGISAILTVGRNHVHEVRDFEVTNSKGCLRVDLLNNLLQTALGESQENFVAESSYPKRDHLYIEHDHFYDSILNNKEAVITAEDGVKAINLIDRVLESLETGREVLFDE